MRRYGASLVNGDPALHPLLGEESDGSSRACGPIPAFPSLSSEFVAPRHRDKGGGVRKDGAVSLIVSVGLEDVFDHVMELGRFVPASSKVLDALVENLVNRVTCVGNGGAISMQRKGNAPVLLQSLAVGPSGNEANDRRGERSEGVGVDRRDG